MLRKPKTVAFWVGRLPHWEVEDGRYFVTIHLAGAIPAQGRTRLRALSVVMPTHVHLFFELVRLGLKETLEDFKRWTGHQAGTLLDTGGDRFWQREWFDHWSRSDDEDEKIARYIRENPMKARLVRAPGQWPYASNSLPPGGI